MPVAIACAGCGKLHEFPQPAAIEQVWCDGCGELIEAKEGIRRTAAAVDSVLAARNVAAPIPGSVLREFPRRKSRPISVHVILLAGALAVFMEILAVLSSVLGVGSPAFFTRIIFHPWWIFLLVWMGLLFNSRRAAKCATVGGVIVAFLLCNFALSHQIAMWGANPRWSDLVWGTVRVMLRSIPLLVVVVALGTRSAREYYHPVRLD